MKPVLLTAILVTVSPLALAQQGMDASPAETSACLLYTSPSPRDVEESRMPSSA